MQQEAPVNSPVVGNDANQTTVKDNATTDKPKEVYKFPKTTNKACANKKQQNLRVQKNNGNFGISKRSTDRSSNWRRNHDNTDYKRHNSQFDYINQRSFEPNLNANRHQDRYHWKKVQTTNPVCPITEKSSAKKSQFTFGFLTNLSKQDSNEAISALAAKKLDFEFFLQDVPSELMVITIRVLSNVCRANFSETVANILVPSVSGNFLEKLDTYIIKLPYEKDTEKRRNKLYYDDVNRFWNDLIDYFKKLIELLPSKASDGLRPILEKIDTTFEIIEKFQKFYRIDENVKRAALTLYEVLEAEIKRIKGKPKATLKPIDDVEESPPNDFRDLNIIPTVEDMTDDQPFIRKCKITEPYSSVNHYLDIQFRLLREDFIHPLRNGLKEYMNPNNSQNYRNDDLRIYRNVTLMTPNVKDDSIGITVSFPIMKRVNWRQSKRFIYGGLVLLSSDNFNTILFATVAHRDEIDLANGQVMLEPCENTVITREMYNKYYVMLESKIYFEPYWAVLNVMKHLSEDNFPMRRYLIDADNSNRLPEYIRDVSSLSYCKSGELPLTNKNDWPSAKSLNMDETQLNAYRSALTQEFSLIQGPPGTGKTFIALKIVDTLLQNQEYWKEYGPIVVVCLTNHALDQFLEGILKSTKNIVRVGSRSKNEAMKPYTLAERRKRQRSTAASSMLYRSKRSMEEILRDVREILLHISYLKQPNVIVPVNILKRYCHDETLNNFFESNEDLLVYLINLDINSYSTIPGSGVHLAGYKEEQQSQEIKDDEQTNDQIELKNIPEFERDYKKSRMDDDLELNNLYKANHELKPIHITDQIDIMRFKILTRLSKCKKQQLKGSPINLEFFQLSERLRALEDTKFSVQQELKQHSVINPNRVASNDPYWESYWNWVKDSYENARDQLHCLEEIHRKIRLELNDARQLVNLATLKGHSIIGLTTTGAAKIFDTLQALHAPIVLVEEAAEILESHVVCSLTKASQQVILIGDHKQLKPKASVYKLGKDYNLNISLFERMVRIMGDCTQLAYQHRMRPLFAKLVTPSIYKTLHNHKSVLHYPNVAGLKKNLFFINHVEREQNHDMDDSWINNYEAEFLVALARYLILQGYSSEDITILCTYKGQLFTLMKEKRRYSSILQDLRVTTVDDFQGEENKIILLSLVRNNGEGKIGFLREENRVCVALSRAREGLYIMGNMDDLVVKNDIWPKIKITLQEENAIGDALTLRCQIHPDQFIEAKTVKDFQRSPEGGCSKICGIDMSCGHSCLRICHPLDREHKECSCRQACLKACPFDHPCKLLCYEGCRPCKVEVERELNCGHTVKMFCSDDPETFPCYIMVEATLVSCGHQIRKPCHLAVESCRCSHPCDSRLLCGHTCLKTCHVNVDPDHIEYKCTKNCARTYSGCENNHECKKKCHEECGLCPIIVEKMRSCGHFYKNAQCGNDLEKEVCLKPCKRDIPKCGHKCKQKCSESCGNCQIMVEKESIECGHKVQIKCCEEARPSKCNGKCPKYLPCGHACTEKCKNPCTINCKVMVKISEPGLCGHIFEVPCYLRSTDSKSVALLKYCKEPCKTKLACQHLCKGNCGDCRQGRLHMFCGEPCGFPLVCGHLCDNPCREACKPCNRACELHCVHSKCKQKCGMPCSPCIEPCSLGCEHKKCKKRCSEICNIEPCIEPCKKKLKCDHPCVGFCGDPCPPLCKICDKDELTELFLGDEDNPDARFVFLEDCNHCIESNGLLKWLESDNSTIKVKACPKCKTPIKKCKRLMNEIKKDLSDVQLVKKKVFYGKYKDTNEMQSKHFITVKKMLSHQTVQNYPEIKEFLKKLQGRLNFVSTNRKRQILNAQDIDTCRVIIDIINHMIEVLNLTENTVKDIRLKLRMKIPNKDLRKIQPKSLVYKDPKLCDDYISSYKLIELQISTILNSIPFTWQLPEQRLVDMQLELLRLHYMVKLQNIYFEFINKNPSIGVDFVCSYLKTYNLAIKTLTSIKRFDDTLEAEALDTINSVQISLNKASEKIVLAERRMIVQAMGFKQGHWYKCPNGHPYVIADCGGATQIAKCNECGEQIGGTQHRLLSSNKLATEMDGASNPAWPQ